MAPVKLEHLIDEVQIDSEQRVPLPREPQSVDEPLQVVENGLPNFLVDDVVAGPDIVQEAAVGKTSNFGLLESFVKRQIGQFFVGFVLSFKLDDIFVVCSLGESLVELLARLYLPIELFGDVSDAGDEVEGELVFFRVVEVQFDDPLGVLVASGLALLVDLPGLLEPLFGLEFGVLVELEDHEGGEHGFVVLVEELVLAVVGDRLEQLHAEVVDVVHLFAGLQHLPVVARTARSVLEHLLRLVHKGLLRHPLLNQLNLLDSIKMDTHQPSPVDRPLLGRRRGNPR